MKIVVLSHGNLAEGLIEACRFIVNDSNDMYGVSLDENGIEVFERKLKKLLDSLEGETVLFLCDLKHGSPHNQLIIQLLEYGKKMEYAILTGVNLPILLQADMMKGESLSVVYKECQKAGLEGIMP